MSTMRRAARPRSTTLGSSLICLLALALVLLGSRLPLRPVVVLVAIVLGTGSALVGGEDLLTARGFSLAVTVGLSVVILISLAATYVPWWHPLFLSELILGADVVLNLLRFGRSTWGHRR